MGEIVLMKYFASFDFQINFQACVFFLMNLYFQNKLYDMNILVYMISAISQ